MPVTQLFFPASDTQSETAQERDTNSNELEEASPLLPKQDRRTWLDFDRAFPSIIKTADCLRDARNSHSLCAVASLVEVFLMCARSTIHEIHRSFLDPHSDASYELSKAASEFLISLLHGKAKAQVQVQDDDRYPALDTMLDLVDMIIANLKELTRVALRITRDKKPLPALPSSRPDLRSSHTRDGEDRLSILDYELVGSDVDEESYPSQSFRFLFGNRLRGLFKISPSIAATSADYSASSTTLVNSDSSSSGNSITPKATSRSRRNPDVPYVLRQSTYFMPSGAVHSDSDTESQSIMDDLTLVRSSQSGELKGASFVALVRMLTSKRAILDPDFIPSFFSGFRFFSSVELFFGELKSRFDEKPPDGQGITQLKTWTKKMVHTRIRVGKILLLWLTDYWQPDADGKMLGPLHVFALQRLRNELPASLVTPILEMIDSRMTGDELYAPTHRDKSFKSVASHVMQAKIEPTGFSYPDKFDKDIEAVLTLFSTEIGKEEFVQQLTAIVSAMFRKFNPRDVVTYWHTHSDSELGPSLSETTSFARSFAMFVTHSILMQQQRDRRCQRLEFWVNVATICLHYRNYFGSHCVFAGITHSAINRLKGTILDLSKPVKMQFRRLDQFFSGHLNHALVRKAMDKKTAATVPLLVPLKKDIIGIKHVPPTIKAKSPHDEQTVINLVPFRVLVKTIRAIESALIPYGIPEAPGFGWWLKMTLECYPTEKEDKLCDSFYEESRRMEPKTKDFEQVNDPWGQYFQPTKQGKKVLRRLTSDDELLGQKAVGRRGGKKSFRALEVVKP